MATGKACQWASRASSNPACIILQAEPDVLKLQADAVRAISIDHPRGKNQRQTQWTPSKVNPLFTSSPNKPAESDRFRSRRHICIRFRSDFQNPSFPLGSFVTSRFHSVAQGGTVRERPATDMKYVFPIAHTPRQVTLVIRLSFFPLSRSAERERDRESM